MQLLEQKGSPAAPVDGFDRGEPEIGTTSLVDREHGAGTGRIPAREQAARRPAGPRLA